MVFVDDNPVERGLVRELLPQSRFQSCRRSRAIRAHACGGRLLEATAFSAEDRRRADSTAITRGASRCAIRQRSGRISGFARDENCFFAVDATGRSRIAQLINKSNQFNLTTRRYDESDVAAFEADRDSFTLQVRLLDRFGDNGMIGVVICRAGRRERGRSTPG